MCVCTCLLRENPLVGPEWRSSAMMTRSVEASFSAFSLNALKCSGLLPMCQVLALFYFCPTMQTAISHERFAEATCSQATAYNGAQGVAGVRRRRRAVQAVIMRQRRKKGRGFRAWVLSA